MTCPLYTHPSAEQVRRHLDEIVVARPFRRSTSLTRFLRFVVEQALAGKANELKEYPIGVQVFDRGAGFDPRVDPIVRVQAGKLRERLENFYRQDPVGGPIRIVLPRGTYVPQFCGLATNSFEAAEVGQHPPTPAGPALAILAFLNLTGDSSQDYLCDGLSEELISLAGSIPDLKVIARTSSFAFKGNHKNLMEVGQALGADLVMEGSVQKRDRLFRFTARLNDVGQGHQLWAHQFDGRFEDVLKFERETMEHLARTVHREVPEGVSASKASSTPAAARNHRLYLQAWHHWSRNTPESMTKAAEYFERIVASDAADAKALAGVALSYAVLGTFELVPANLAREKAIPAAEAAVHHGPGLAEAWQALGSVRSMLEWDWEPAEQAYRRAIFLNPNYSLARHAYAVNCLATSGRTEESIAEMLRAVHLDPVSTVANCDLATLYMYGRRYQESIAQYKQTLELDPNYSRARLEMAYPILLQGDVASALALFDNGPLDRDSVPHVQAIYALALAVAGRPEESENVLQRFRRCCPGGEYTTVVPVWTLDILGKREAALDLLECLLERRDPQIRYLGVDPFADRLRGEPRFEQARRRMNLR